MINFKLEKSMYDLFIDKDVLTTKELLSIGFTNKDLTRLVEDGKIRRVKRGYYDLEKANGLFKYCQILLSKQYRNLERAKKGLKKCALIEPASGVIHTRLFLDYIIAGEYEQALKSFEVMDKTDNEFYKKDQNMWLFLLSFIVDLPDEYKDRVKNMQLVDMLSLNGDLRYKDKLLQNKIRSAIYKLNFKEAQELSKNGQSNKDKKINGLITEKLLTAVIRRLVDDNNHLYELIVQGEYEEAERLLSASKELHGIHYIDEQFLIVIRDLIGILKDKKIPEVDTSIEIKSFNSAVKAHDYNRLLEMYKDLAGEMTSKSSKFMGILLERVDSELSKLKLSDNAASEIEILEEDEVVVNKEADALFTNITVSLMNQDVDTAFSLLDEYLGSIGKSNFRGYVADLIKLDALKKDTSFSEAMLLLSTLSRDEFDFNVATYIQDFYFNLARKNFKEAAIYLDILSMSHEIGGVKINTLEMKERLLEDAAISGLSEEDLGIRVHEEKKEEPVKNEVVVPEEKIIKVEDLMQPLEEKKEVIEKSSYNVVDVVDELLNDTNMIMLEPMSQEDIDKVLDVVNEYGKILAIVIEQDGERRVVLRYFDKYGPYVDIPGTLKEAGYKYGNWEYDDAIDLYQLVLPKLETPRSFIYANLGFSYQKTSYDGDYSKAIDYLTMAMAQSANETEFRDYSKVISELKAKSGYNGRVVDGIDADVKIKRKIPEVKQEN